VAKANGDEAPQGGFGLAVATTVQPVALLFA
jgi:hypothetical protein